MKVSKSQQSLGNLSVDGFTCGGIFALHASRHEEKSIYLCETMYEQIGRRKKCVHVEKKDDRVKNLPYLDARDLFSSKDVLTVFIRSTNGTSATAALNRSGRMLTTLPINSPPALRPQMARASGDVMPLPTKCSAQSTKSFFCIDRGRIESEGESEGESEAKTRREGKTGGKNEAKEK